MCVCVHLTFGHAVQHHVNEDVRASPTGAITVGERPIMSRNYVTKPSCCTYCVSTYFGLTRSERWLGRIVLDNIYSPSWKAETKDRKKEIREQRTETDTLLSTFYSYFSKNIRIRVFLTSFRYGWIVFESITIRANQMELYGMDLWECALKDR